eukprot:2867777-Rhodomonas_salina.1
MHHAIFLSVHSQARGVWPVAADHLRIEEVLTATCWCAVPRAVFHLRSHGHDVGTAQHADQPRRLPRGGQAGDVRCRLGLEIHY